jgi:hypothetical protein
MMSSMPKPTKESMRDSTTEELRKHKETHKVTLYIERQIIRDFKKMAIDRDLPFSALAEHAFSSYLSEHQQNSSNRD